MGQENERYTAGKEDSSRASQKISGIDDRHDQLASPTKIQRKTCRAQVQWPEYSNQRCLHQETARKAALLAPQLTLSTKSSRAGVQGRLARYEENLNARINISKNTIQRYCKDLYYITFWFASSADLIQFQRGSYHLTTPRLIGIILPKSHSANLCSNMYHKCGN